MRLIDADALIKKHNQVKDFSTQPEVYVIRQGYVMDASTIDFISGRINFNGNDVDVRIKISDSMIVISMPEDTDTKNWYHAVRIETVDNKI